MPAGEAPATRRRTVPIPVVITPRPAVPGLVWAYRFDEAGRGQRLADDQPIDLALPGEGFRWLHLNLVDRRACHWLANHPALPPAAREIHRIEREPPGRLPPPLIETAARIAQRLDALDGDIVAIQQQARLLQDEINSRIARVNRHLYILSVITALFLPPSVIAGIFGMNLGGLPLTGSPSGFLVGMLLIAASPVPVYLVLWLVRRAPSLEDPGPAPG